MMGWDEVRTLQVPYDALRTLYEGSAEVRLYRNQVTGTHRVGKRVDLHGIEEAVAVNEAKALESIAHPNLVKVIDVFVVTGYPAPMRVVELVMPYHARQSVFDAFERGQWFSLAEAVRHAEAALRGLGHLHEVHGILHRDVKSPNLILAEDGSLLKVGDLGVAVRMDEEGTAPAFQAAHPYIPPETYLRGRVARAADIYGLGLVLFEMASQPFPYEQYSVDGLARRLEKGQRGPRPRDLVFRPHVPAHLRRVINKATSKEPEKRFQTAATMSNELARVRLIDWRLVSHDDDLVVWEGKSMQRNDREYRVEAKRSGRGGGWRLAGLQRVTIWRRAVDDVVVGAWADPAAARLFESLVSLATRR